METRAVRDCCQHRGKDLIAVLQRARRGSRHERRAQQHAELLHEARVLERVEPVDLAFDLGLAADKVREACASNSSLRAAMRAPSATMSSAAALALGNISFCSSLTWCFTYSDRTLTLASYISPSGSAPSSWSIRSLTLACSIVASGTSSLSFRAFLTAG
jgi:hypothetical protein